MITLTYFNAPGRAEPVRLALHLSKIPFNDERLSFQEFAARKSRGDFPLGSVPVMTVDGQVFTQTAAMLRYVAKLGGGALYPSDAMQAFVVDSALDTFNDTLMGALLPSLFERDADKKLELRAAFTEGPLTRCCGYVEGLIARSGGPYLLGDTLSIADLMIAHQVGQIVRGGLDGVAPSFFDGYPKLKALHEAYAASVLAKTVDAR